MPQHLKEIEIGASSQYLWRGYSHSLDPTLQAGFVVGLAGRDATTRGRFGLSLEGVGSLGVSDRESNPLSDDIRGAARVRWLLRPAGGFAAQGTFHDSELQAGIRAYHFARDNAPLDDGIEVFGRFEGALTSESAGLTVKPFIEYARDLGAYEGNYLETGIVPAFATRFAQRLASH